MEDEKKFYIAIKGVIFNNNKFLIVQRSGFSRGENFYWEFPGGRMEFGESAEDTLIREIREETGLDVIPKVPISTWKIVRDENMQTIGINYLCNTDTRQVKLSHEHMNFKWVSYEELKNYNIYPSIKKEMEKWDWNYINQKINGGNF